MFAIKKSFKPERNIIEYKLEYTLTYAIAAEEFSYETELFVKDKILQAMQEEVIRLQADDFKIVMKL